MTYGGWDHHDNIKRAMEGQMPNFDQAFARLIRDLDERGMLDNTLVFVTSEFGRTPKINQTAGRDHWGHTFSVLLGNARMRMGQVIGRSSPRGEYVVDRSITPQDVAELKPGQRASVVVLRLKDRLTLSITPVQRPKPRAAPR